jgi:hypothetical protein
MRTCNDVRRTIKPDDDREETHTSNIVILEYRCIECNRTYVNRYDSSFVDDDGVTRTTSITDYYKVIWKGSNPYEAKREHIVSCDDGFIDEDDPVYVTPLEWKCPDHPKAAVLKCHNLCVHDDDVVTCLEEDWKFSYRWSDVF